MSLGAKLLIDKRDSWQTRAVESELLARVASESPGPMPAPYDDAVASIHSVKDRERVLRAAQKRP